MDLARRAPRAALVAACLLGTGTSAGVGLDDPNALPLSVRITSPLGRTGLSEAIRVVAQVKHERDTALEPVRFYIDGALLCEDGEGPPFAFEWRDDNPFESREIRVEVRDEAGRTASDTVVLEPFRATEAADTLSVLLEVSVEDGDGRFVGDMDASHFILREDGEAQTLELVAPETLPATYTLLVDSSQSMARRFDLVQRAAARLAEHLRRDDLILVAPFSRALGPITGPTDDRATVADAVATIKPQGGTAILESLANVATHLDGLDGRHVVVLVTDGYDEHSTVKFDAALDAVRQTRATVYVIGIGGVAGISLRGAQLLKRVAAETGGRVFFPARDSQLPAVHELVAADVQHRYLVGYTPTNQNHDGRFRRISLASVEPGHRIRTRPGYFAPSPPPLRPSLEFTITDRERRYLDVSADDLVVLEDGVEQQVDTFHEVVTPVSVVLALDASGSIRRSTEAVIEAAHTFVDALSPEDRLAVLTFADRPVLQHSLTTDRNVSVEAIDSYKAAGGTALYDAMAESLEHLQPVDGRRVIVVLSDGRDENNPGTAPGSVRTFDHVLERLRETDATVFTIGLGPKIDRRVLERVAAESGGEAYFPEDVTTLADEYRRVIENLRRRYIISYSSTNAARDGTWRAVEIRSRIAGAVIQSRGGYFASVPKR